MMVTLHMVDGSKIIQERDNLIIIRDLPSLCITFQEGKITVNWCNVMFMTEALDEEIEHARIHGW